MSETKSKFHQHAESYLEGIAACHRELSLEKLERIAGVLAKARRERRKIFILGNGGSASTASHMACDLAKNTRSSGMPNCRVIDLASNLASITAWSNDDGYELVFQKQLEGWVETGDVVIGISASGNSSNVLEAIKYANCHGATTIGFIGFGGGKLKSMVQEEITISSCNYGLVEDFHLTLNHILSQFMKS